jgi:hypothetical protein
MNVMPISLGVEGRGLKSVNAVPVLELERPAEQVSVLYWLHGIATYGRGRPLNAPAAFMHPCQPRVKLS